RIGGIPAPDERAEAAGAMHHCRVMPATVFGGNPPPLITPVTTSAVPFRLPEKAVPRATAVNVTCGAAVCTEPVLTPEKAFETSEKLPVKLAPVWTKSKKKVVVPKRHRPVMLLMVITVWLVEDAFPSMT